MSPEDVWDAVDRIDSEHYRAVIELEDEVKKHGISFEYDWHDGVHHVDGRRSRRES